MLKTKWAVFPVLIVGIIALIVSVKTRQSTKEEAVKSHYPLVEVAALKYAAIKPRIKGYGVIEPTESWQVTSSVSGKVIYRHPKLNTGYLLEEGVEYLTLDDADYQIKRQQAEATLVQAQASLAKLSQQKRNLLNTLKLEKEKLDLLKTDLMRKQRLQSKGLNAAADIDAQQRTVLIQEGMVQSIENELSLLPHEVQTAQAQIQIAQSQKLDAETAISRTHFITDKTVYIDDVLVSAGQWINTGQSIANGYAPGHLEVMANFSPKDLSLLGWKNQFGDIQTTSNAEVVWRSAGEETSWSAKVTRLGSVIETSTSSQQVILDIGEATRGSELPQKGMLVEVKLEGYPRKYTLVPERGIHGDQIYLLGEDDTLNRVSINELFRQGGYAAVSQTFPKGTMMVTTDVLPFVDGMKVRTLTEQSGAQ